MSERTVTLQTPDGPMDVFVTTPEGDGPFPAVIQFMDAPGVRDELKDLARRYTAAGVAVALPDLYHHFGQGISFDFSVMVSQDEEAKATRARIVEMVGKLGDDLVMDDARAVLDFLRDDDQFDTRRRGCVGYCMGGRAVVRALAAYPDEICAGAAMHPSRLMTDQPDSAHLGIADFADDAELYLGLGGEDPQAAPEVVAAVEEQLHARGIDYKLDLTPGAQHGFVMQGRHHPEADRLHWERTLDLLRRRVAA